nr:trimethylamine methyltransferase family protein [Cypionkella sp.]
QETTMAIWGALMGQATMVLHAAGWLEGGLTFGYEKFINDIEMLQSIAEICVRPGDSLDDLALDAIAEVPPGGHFFAAAHTMQRYEHAFYPPLLADLSNFGSWTAAGARDSAARAAAIWQKVLADFTPPAQSAEIADRLAPYIETQTKAGGAPPLD